MVHTHKNNSVDTTEMRSLILHMLLWISKYFNYTSALKYKKLSIILPWLYSASDDTQVLFCTHVRKNDSQFIWNGLEKLMLLIYKDALLEFFISRIRFSLHA